MNIELTRKSLRLFRNITHFTLMILILLDGFPPFNILNTYYARHILCAIYIFYFIFYILNKCDFKLKLTIECKNVLIAIFILWLISFVKQITKGIIGVYTLKELYFLIVPLLFVYIIFTFDDQIDSYIKVIFYTLSFCFLFTFISNGKLNIQTIVECFNIFKTMIDSMTPIESILGNYFFLTYFYFFYRKKYVLTVASAFFVILCAKRFSIVFLFLSIAFFLFVRKKGTINFSSHPSKLAFWLTVGLFIYMPIQLYILYSNPQFSIVFSKITGLDLTYFSMARNLIFELAMSSGANFAGLGSVTNILEHFNIPGMTNLHNDLMMLYMDCGIVGLVAFAYYYFKLCNQNWITFFIMIFVFIELFTAHYLGSGTLGFWIIVYFLVFYFNRKQGIEK